MATKAILFDMDGVIYNSERLIAGAPDTLTWVREQKIPHLFVTNTTSRGRSVLVEKLERFGIPADASQILTPCVATMDHLADHLADHLREGETVALFVPPKAVPEFEGVPLLSDDAPDDQGGVRWVVIGDLGEAWTFARLNRAFRLLKANPEAKLVALGMTRFWQAQDGLRMDAGAYAAALAYAASREPLVMGKPAGAFFQAAAHKLNIDPREILMIGDDILVDVGGAQAAGLKGALVKTGKYREGDLSGKTPPDAIFDSIVDLPAWWRNQAQSDQ